MLPVTHAEMETKIPGYPAATMTQAFANAIPRGKSYEEELIHAHILFLRDFSKVINPSLRDRGDLALLDSFQTALKAALGNRNPERNARHVTLLIHMGVLVVPGMDVESTLLMWLRDARSRDIPVNGLLLRKRAEQLAVVLGHDDGVTFMQVAVSATAKAGFRQNDGSSDEESSVPDDETSDPSVWPQVREAFKADSFSDFVTFDNGVVDNEELTDEEVRATIKGRSELSSDNDSEHKDEFPAVRLTSQQVIDRIDEVKDYFQLQQDDCSVEVLQLSEMQRKLVQSYTAQQLAASEDKEDPWPERESHSLDSLVQGAHQTQCVVECPLSSNVELLSATGEGPASEELEEPSESCTSEVPAVLQFAVKTSSLSLKAACDSYSVTE
ncbi:hypothetical protein HPB50_008676 [Hyalomma asiaticum]|uniref:Uncharacterized protein n=1 Tax=Hyalomma asiaticum TaxID=266040 RepID=A0ACB7SMB9_HYAAI|nr:hypothetical protein HPB50_008676 [Hyalomma asiaticum]